MKPVLRLKQGVLIALVLLIGLAAAATATVASITHQRNQVLEQSVAARTISRLSTRMLVLTHMASTYLTDTNVRQWWVVHESMSSELDHLKFSDENGEFSIRLEEKLSDLSELFSSYSHLGAIDLGLESRRNEVLTDRLISEAEQLAELSYKVSDAAFVQQELLTHQRKAIVLVFAVLFAINSFLLLVLIRYRVVRPLGQIERVANDMRAGNLTARCELPEGDELGDVAGALDSLAFELDSRIADLNSTTHLLEVAGRMCGVGAWTLNMSTNELRWSKQIFEIVEADFTHQPTLADVMQLYPDDSAEKLEHGIEEARRTGKDLNMELQFRTYKGNLIWVHVFGEVSGDMILGAFLDITKRRQVEAEILLAKEMAESASKAKGDFLSNISHEIRTPLNAVVGLAYILKQTKLDSTQMEFLDKLENAGRGLVDLVSGVLDVSKIEAGAMELEHRPFSARGLLDSLADLMTGAVASKNIEFVVSVAPNVPDYLIGDETKLRQVLVNLAGNAIKFTENGYVKVGLTLDQLESNSCVLRFVVQDTGLGMDAGAMKRLFQSFSQADASISRRFGGTGIGLALSQKLVELMGGTISAVSAPGQGSLFAFSLMLNLDLEQTTRDELPAIGAGLEVVVVDSFKPQLEAMVQMMQALGVKAHGFTHARQALDFTLNQECGLFVANHHLADMSGQEFSRLLKLRHGKNAARVALMVGSKELDQVQDSFDGGRIDSLMIKPISSSRIKSTLFELISDCAHTQVAATQGQRHPDDQALKGLRVLAVDDHKLNLMILRKVLEGHGATVLLAESGAAAIETLSRPDRCDVDVCLMDVQMPDMDGLQTCEYIRHQLGMKQLPILALTAGVMAADHQLAREAGMNEVLTKPLEIDKVLDAVQRWSTQLPQKARNTSHA